MQACINCATSLKFFKLDGRYDVICSGSLMGINYQEITIEMDFFVRDKDSLIPVEVKAIDGATKSLKN